MVAPVTRLFHGYLMMFLQFVLLLLILRFLQSTDIASVVFPRIPAHITPKIAPGITPVIHAEDEGQGLLTRFLQ